MKQAMKPKSNSAMVKTTSAAKKPFKVCASCPTPNKCVKAGACPKKTK